MAVLGTSIKSPFLFITVGSTPQIVVLGAPVLHSNNTPINFCSEEYHHAHLFSDFDVKIHSKTTSTEPEIDQGIRF